MNMDFQIGTYEYWFEETFLFWDKLIRKNLLIN